jgi:hypothetical protein
MAISFIGSAAGSSAANTDTTITLPGAAITNDLIIVAYGIGDNDSVDQNVAMTTGGYTEVADLLGDDVQDISFGVYYRYHDTAILTAVCDALAAGTDAAVAGVCMVFRGVALLADGGPFDTVATTATGIDSANPNPPSITTSGASGIWTVIAGGTGLLETGAATYTNPTNYTTNGISQGFEDTSDVVVGMGYRTNPATTEDPGVMTCSLTAGAANDGWCAVTMALKEAPAAGATSLLIPTGIPRALLVR